MQMESMLSLSDEGSRIFGGSQDVPVTCLQNSWMGPSADGARQTSNATLALLEEAFGRRGNSKV